MNKKYIEPHLSFKNSKLVIERNIMVDKQIGLMADIYKKQREQVIHEVNKLVFQIAEGNNRSVYDICFNTIPKESYMRVQFNNENLSQTCSINGEIQLVPIKFELEKGPDYWESKYYELKQKMQDLIDNKEGSK